MATDEVTDMIAHIEMHRQEMAKEASLAAACGDALRKLHELLEQERAASQQGASASHHANIEAITTEIRRVKQLIGAANPKSSRKTGPRQQPVSRSNAWHTPARHKRRRTMGRRGEN